MEELLGQKVSALFVDRENQTALIFVTENGPLVYQVDADCCSESWFADITGVQALLGEEVTSVEGLDTDNMQQDNRCRQSVDAFYGFKLTTRKGYVDIVFRNSSNGYYGGDIDAGHWRPKDFQPPANVYEQITDDWSA